MQIALGTAQFGMDYGISSQKKTSLDEVKVILKFAQDNGVAVLDTACAYGESESVLGTVLREDKHFQIITKTPLYQKDKINLKDAITLKTTFFESLKKLRKSKLTGLLVHNANDLLTDGGENLFYVMQDLKNDGYVEKIGVSVYSGDQIDGLLKRYAFDIIQAPINVLDRRLILSGHLAKLKEKGVEIHARSVFLQGLLLMEPSLLYSFFDPIKPLLYKYRDFLFANGLTDIEGALGFVKQIEEIDYIIIGVNNLEQLKININSFAKFYCDNSISDRFKGFSLNNPLYLNPGLWRVN